MEGSVLLGGLEGSDGLLGSIVEVIGSDDRQAALLHDLLTELDVGA